MITRGNPFPGIRPFNEDESELFFGREAEVDELLRRIRSRSRFLAITGTSGCGKSSLVRAGLLPSLKAGLLADAGPQWRIAALRPSVQPSTMLATALSSALETETEQIEPTLRRSSLGLIDAARQARLGSKENLLICVDQFEEILVHGSDRDESIAFVKLLFEATRQQEIPIYVLLVFRSDFLGSFADFRHLPEAFNDGLYLMPRMRRDHLRLAIEGPSTIMGISIANRLTQRILNDVPDHPDYLVSMQHALFRTWEKWQYSSKFSDSIDLQHYEYAGGIAALGYHAEQIFAELPGDHQKIACKIFQRLTSKDPGGRVTRRPTRFSELCAVTTQSGHTIDSVIYNFHRAGLLLRSELVPDTIIDLPHDSLIRQWTRLGAWTEEEAKSAATYLRLSEAAQRYSRGEAALLSGPDLKLALEWQEDTAPNHAWASRYDSGFETAMLFLKRSKSAGWRRFWNIFR